MPEAPSISSGAITVQLNVANGTTGSISGNVTLSGGLHKLFGGSTNNLVFQSGSVCTAGTGFSGIHSATGVPQTAS